MIIFQFITVPILGAFFIISIIKLIQGKKPRVLWIVNAAIWLIASITILQPDVTQKIAGMLGIGRGADLLLYFLAISFLCAIIYIYNRFQKLESNITEIIRLLALRSDINNNPKHFSDSERGKE